MQRMPLDSGRSDRTPSDKVSIGIWRCLTVEQPLPVDHQDSYALFDNFLDPYSDAVTSPAASRLGSTMSPIRSQRHA